jgi:V8-like Glu-specific endopeptidase
VDARGAGDAAGRRQRLRPHVSSVSWPWLAVAVPIAVTACLTLLGSGAPRPVVRTVNAAVLQTSPVGALFTRTAAGSLGRHFCTASVVDSPTGDLAVTAAHCVGPQMAGQIAFVPGYAAGKTPDGVWTVTAILMDKQWTSSRDPDDDFAFLLVSRPGAASVQQLAGGEAIGIDVAAGQQVKLAGYNDSQDALTSCESTARLVNGTQFELDCAGFEGGTSGSPFLAAAGQTDRAMVIGVLGGYQQGGVSSSVSYAARFNAQLVDLYRAAVTASENWHRGNARRGVRRQRVAAP